jgi:nucleoside-diphosphate-sugar epimerase
MARVLVAGGVGFVGRNLVTFLANNKLASKIIVADKALPEVSGLSESEMAIFKSDIVVFKQANLAKEGTTIFLASSFWMGNLLTLVCVCQ